MPWTIINLINKFKSKVIEFYAINPWKNVHKESKFKYFYLAINLCSLILLFIIFLIFHTKFWRVLITLLLSLLLINIKFCKLIFNLLNFIKFLNLIKLSKLNINNVFFKMLENTLLNKNNVIYFKSCLTLWSLCGYFHVKSQNMLWLTKYHFWLVDIAYYHNLLVNEFRSLYVLGFMGSDALDYLISYEPLDYLEFIVILITYYLMNLINNKNND